MKKKPTPSYIHLNGAVYEKMTDDTVELEIELDIDVLQQLDDLVIRDGFVSRGEALRYILREAMTVESFKVEDNKAATTQYVDDQIEAAEQDLEDQIAATKGEFEE